MVLAQIFADIEGTLTHDGFVDPSNEMLLKELISSPESNVVYASGVRLTSYQRKFASGESGRTLPLPNMLAVENGGILYKIGPDGMLQEDLEWSSLVRGENDLLYHQFQDWLDSLPQKFRTFLDRKKVMAIIPQTQIAPGGIEELSGMTNGVGVVTTNQGVVELNPVQSGKDNVAAYLIDKYGGTSVGMGDGENDKGLLELVGTPLTFADAHSSVVKVVSERQRTCVRGYITPLNKHSGTQDLLRTAQNIGGT